MPAQPGHSYKWQRPHKMPSEENASHRSQFMGNLSETHSQRPSQQSGHRTLRLSRREGGEAETVPALLTSAQPCRACSRVVSFL